MKRPPFQKILSPAAAPVKCLPGARESVLGRIYREAAYMSEAQVRLGRLSTKWTPVLRIEGVPLFALAMVAGIIAGYGSCKDPVWLRIVLGCVTGIPILLVGWLLVSLKTVQADESGLFVQGVFRSCKLPYSEIEEVRSRWFLSWPMFIAAPPFVKIILNRPSCCGDKFRFLPRVTLSGWQERVHPDVIFLREMLAKHTS
ncbi:MAG: PH domain-containing protein [Planctomycetes bacterium]|nr:PH domain-containing protein [Planctomycetota bacterium]